MKRIANMLALVIATACSGAGGDSSRDGAAAALDSTRPTALLPLPAPFAEACVGGDADAGVAWNLANATAPALAEWAIDSMAPRDSARLAARIARMVDVLPSDTSRADFRGIPVAVRGAWRVIPADGDTVVVALAVRKVPIESEPLEELFAVIAAPAERPGVPGALAESWVQREVGSEDELRVRDLAGAFIADSALVLAFSSDEQGGVRIELQRRSGATWSAWWDGVLARCPAP